MTGPIKLCFAFGIENMAGQDGEERESAKLEPLGLQIESSMPVDILRELLTFLSVSLPEA